MDRLRNARFIVSGKDKKALIDSGKILKEYGHVQLGYVEEPLNLLRSIRSTLPDLVIVDVETQFADVDSVVNIIDQELLCACILLVNNRDNMILDFIERTRSMCYVLKNVYQDSLIQMTDLLLLSFKRACFYESKIKKLNNTLDSRKSIEKAKWILVKERDITEEQAYEILRKKSRDSRLSMGEIAGAVILSRGL